MLELFQIRFFWTALQEDGCLLKRAEKIANRSGHAKCNFCLTGYKKSRFFGRRERIQKEIEEEVPVPVRQQEEEPPVQSKARQVYRFLPLKSTQPPY